MKVILGGGIGGLTAAYYLRNKFPQEIIKLYESSEHLGGWIKSTKLPNGTIFEQGPRTLRPKGEAGHNTLELIDDLGISDQIKPIYSSHPAAKNRMIYANGKLHTLPSSLPDIFIKHTPFAKPLIYYILRDLVAKPGKKCDDESIYSFVARRFGEDVAKYAISPMICGICAGNAKEISVKFLMKSIFEKEQKYGGVIKGVLWDLIKNPTKKQETKSVLVDQAVNEKWSIYSFDGGIEILSETLKQNLMRDQVDVLINHSCDRIEFVDDKVLLRVNGEQKECDHLICSLPAVNLSKLLVKHRELSGYLTEIPFVDVAVVNLQYKHNVIPMDAFGFLVPPSENLPILGVIFDSCCFPTQDGDTVLTVMMGGHWFNQIFGANPRNEEVLNIAVEHVKHILKISQPPENHKISILRNCIPQYVVGHNETVKKIENYIHDKKLRLSICGSSYYGVGVNDVILSAKQSVQNI